MIKKRKKQKKNITTSKTIKPNCFSGMENTSTPQLSEAEELDQIITSMKLEAKSHMKYMQEQKAQDNKLKPQHDEVDSIYLESYKKAILTDNNLKEALQVTMTEQEISFELKKKLLGYSFLS